VVLLVVLDEMVKIVSLGGLLDEQLEL